MPNTALIVKRMILKHVKTDVVERVVYVEDDYKCCWMIDVDIDDTSWPRSVPKAEILELIEHGDYKIVLDDEWLPQNSEYEADTTAGRRHEERYELIKPIVTEGNEREVLYKSRRKQLINDQVIKTGKTRQHISHLLKLFWKRGMTYEAVQTFYNNCGNLNEKRNPKGAKVGHPRVLSPGIGCNVTEVIRKQFQVGVDYYNSKKSISIENAYDKVIELYFSEQIINEKGRSEIVLIDDDQRPTLRQFRYYEQTTNKLRNKYIDKEGQKKWDLNYRPLLGSSAGEVQGPGDKFQVDATIADVYLLSQFDRRRIVGRPVIYFIIDVFSRLITGVYVGFEGPSWIGAMMVLTNMVMNKVEFCRQYGVEIEEADWPCCHSPKAILADRGELMSTRLGFNITQRLHIGIENTSTGRADLKAIVERRFGIVPSKFKRFTPGYVEPDYAERGAPDYRLRATFNLKEFTRQVIYAVLIHNMTPIRDLLPPGQMISDGLEPTPLDLWNWGITHRSGALRTISEVDMKLNVMPPDKATVTRLGIRFKSAYYYCNTALIEDWFSTKSPMQGKKVDISFDPRFMDQIYLRGSRNLRLKNGYEVCKLLSRSSDFEGKSLYEVEENDLKNKTNIASNKDSKQAKRIAYNKKMAENEENAKEEKKSLGNDTRSNQERTENIRNNRNDEKIAQRPREAFQVGKGFSDSEIVSEAHSDECSETTKLDDSDSDYRPYNPLDILEINISDRKGGAHE